MSLQPVKTTAAGDITVWQNVFETALGGFTLDTTGLTTLAAGSVLKAGLPFGFDESTRKARCIKVATLYANATNSATTYQVLKGHNAIVGEYFGYTVGGAAYAITAIDISNAGYDILTVGTTLGVAITAGNALFQSSATGASAAALIVTPKGLLYDETDPAANATLSVVIRGTVYHRRIPTVPASIKTALSSIQFSEAY
jgi:hypothetical protein